MEKIRSLADLERIKAAALPRIDLRERSDRNFPAQTCGRGERVR